MFIFSAKSCKKWSGQDCFCDARTADECASTEPVFMARNRQRPAPLNVTRTADGFGLISLEPGKVYERPWLDLSRRLMSIADINRLYAPPSRVTSGRERSTE